jgi:multicomponent Na+:H+ antiporter subunit A
VTRLLVLDRSVRLTFHALQLGSLWLLFAGHNQPGGGFVAGLVAGSAVALRYLAGGTDEVQGLSRFAPWTILGAGLLAAGLTATVPVLLGDAVLEAALLELHLPLIGAVTVTSPLVFDIGVYLVVVGLVLMVIEAFGDEPVRPDALDAPGGDR